MQTGLFGDELVSESLYLERAKVLDRTYKMLRADKASFENLSRNAERIEAAGNKLVTSQNKGGPTKMPKRSRSSKRLRPGKARSVTSSQKQQEQLETQTTMQPQQEASPTLSEEELSEAILIGQKLAMLDALSMIRRKAAKTRLKMSQA